MVQVYFFGAPNSIGESRYGNSTETVSLQCCRGWVSNSGSCTCWCFIYLPLGDLGVTRSDWRADPSGSFGSQRKAMAAGTCQEPLPLGRVH